MPEPLSFSDASPRVSVVMAAYNYGQYIAQAIQSVVEQTYVDWELIVVDDGSTDDTREVVARFLGDSRIHYHWQENRGQPQTKNTGINLSRGSLIAFLDADDAWLPTKLEKQAALFDDDSRLGVAYTGRSFMDPVGTVTGREDRVMVRGDVLHEALLRTIPPFSSSMVRREVFDKVGLFDETIPLAIDYELWLRVALEYRFDYVDEPLLLYRTGHANLSRRSVERRQLVLDYILPKFCSMDGVEQRVGRSAIALAYADTYINQANEIRCQSFQKAFRLHLKALYTCPGMWAAWRSLARFCVPVSFRIALKRFRQDTHHPDGTDLATAT